MTLKLLGAAFLLLAGFLAGCFFSRRLSSRIGFLERLLSFVTLLEIRLRYSALDILPMISRCAEQASLEVFSGMAESDEPFSAVWNRRVRIIPSSEGLKPEDTELLLEFGSQLGGTDLEGQLKHLSAYRALFEERLDSAREMYRRKSKLCRALGFLAGAASALVLL